MATYAVVENNLIINVILADSKEIAEEITQKECIEYTEENPLGVGYYWSQDHNKYIMPSPHNGWIFNGEVWTAPVEPVFEEGKFYTWNDETMAWDSNDIEVSE
jgi:hypothetical protein